MKQLLPTLRCVLWAALTTFSLSTGAAEHEPTPTSGVGIKGNAASGEKQFEEQCKMCHYPEDFEEDAGSVIAATLKAFRSGEARHRTNLSKLTDAEIADLAEFLANQ